MTMHAPHCQMLTNGTYCDCGRWDDPPWPDMPHADAVSIKRPSLFTRVFGAIIGFLWPLTLAVAVPVAFVLIFGEWVQMP